MNMIEQTIDFTFYTWFFAGMCVADNNIGVPGAVALAEVIKAPRASLRTLDLSGEPWIWRAWINNFGLSFWFVLRYPLSCTYITLVLNRKLLLRNQLSHMVHITHLTSMFGRCVLHFPLYCTYITLVLCRKLPVWSSLYVDDTYDPSGIQAFVIGMYERSIIFSIFNILRHHSMYRFRVSNGTYTLTWQQTSRAINMEIEK